MPMQQFGKKEGCSVPEALLLNTKSTSRIQKAHPRHNNLNKMKRQRNTQQVKEHEKCPPNQTKEEEIGNLSEKEFRIMIVKMIQNLESKMELQINSLETKIEKMQEMFNKDLEEIKKSQLKMNNALLIVSFAVQKLLSFIRSHLFIFAFVSNILGCGS